MPVHTRDINFDNEPHCRQTVQSLNGPLVPVWFLTRLSAVFYTITKYHMKQSLFTCVSSDMVFQVPCRSKSFITHLTFEWFLSRMRSLMNLETLDGVELFLTMLYITGIGTVIPIGETKVTFITNCSKSEVLKTNMLLTGKRMRTLSSLTICLSLHISEGIRCKLQVHG